MNSKSITFRKLKRILDRDISIKHQGRFFYNDKVAYTCDTSKDMNAARDYYFNMVSRTREIHSEKLIKELIWNKHARCDKVDGKMLYNGIIYDGGEFARQESIKRFHEERKKSLEQYRDHLFEVHNHLTEKKVKEILEDQVVFITQEAKEKAHRISERMVRLTGPNEIRMSGVNFLSKEGDPAIRDIYISNGQIVTPSTCSVPNSENAKLTTRKLLEENKYRTAWIHSHANMSTSHSSIDDANLKTWTGIFGRKINLEVLAENYKSKTDLKIYSSLVFNARRSFPSVEIGAKYWSRGIPGEREIKYFSKKNAPLTVINEQNGIDLSTQTIDKEIMEKVTWPGKSRSENLEETLTGNDLYIPNRPKSFLDITDHGRPIISSSAEKREDGVYLSKIDSRKRSNEDLSRRVGYLERIYNRLVEFYNNLRRDYISLKKEVFQ